MSATAGVTATCPAGWNTGVLTGSSGNGFVSPSGSLTGTSAIVSTGSSTGGANYDFGSTNATDRALGSLASNNSEFAEQVGFTNATGNSLLGFSLSYTGEQWRDGGSNNVNTLVMQISTDGTNFTTLGSAFNFASPTNSAKALTLNGNAAANRITNIGSSYTFGLPIDTGTFYLRWADADDNGSDDGLAIDDVAVAFNYGAAVRTQPAPVSWTGAAGTTNWDHSTLNFTTASAATQFVDGDTVSFNDAQSGSVTIDSNNVSPTSTTVTTNSTYTFTGGSILTGSLTKNGTGTLILSNSANRYTGITAINAGTLVTSSGGLMQSQGMSIANSATLNNTYQGEYIGTLTMSGGSIVGTGSIVPVAIIVGGDHTSTIRGSVSTYGASGALQVLANTGASSLSLDLESNVSGSTPLWLAGNGTILLNGDNTGITSNIQIFSGTHVILGNSKALGSSSTRTYLNPCTISADTDLTGTNALPTALRLSTGVVFAGNYPMEFSGAITVNNLTYFSGIIQDQFVGTDHYIGSILKAGSGTLIVAGANTNTGGISISAGTLTISQSGSFADIPSVTLDTSTAASTMVLQSLNAINPQASVIVTGGSVTAATIALPDGKEQVHALTVNGFNIAAGDYLPGNSTLQADGLTLTGPSDAILEVTTSVPEPAAIAVLGFALPFLSRRGKFRPRRVLK